jgi:hypothetical protein
MKKKPYICSPFFGEFPCVRIPKATVKLRERNLPRAAIPLNYTSEFQYVFEAALYISEHFRSSAGLFL